VRESGGLEYQCVKVREDVGTCFAFGGENVQGGRGTTFSRPRGEEMRTSRTLSLQEGHGERLCPRDLRKKNARIKAMTLLVILGGRKETGR